MFKNFLGIPILKNIRATASERIIEYLKTESATSNKMRLCVSHYK